MIYLVGFFLGIDEQNCILRVLLGFVVWGPEKLFLGVLTKIKFFIYLIRNLQEIRKILKLKLKTQILKKLKTQTQTLTCEYFV